MWGGGIITSSSPLVKPYKAKVTFVQVHASQDRSVHVLYGVSYFLNKRPNGHKFVNRVESDTFYSKAEAQTMADEINDLTEFEMKGKLKKGR